MNGHKLIVSWEHLSTVDMIKMVIQEMVVEDIMEMKESVLDGPCGLR